MIKARNSKGMAFFPLLSMLVNNMVAVAFGIELKDPFVVSVAVVNGLLSLFYVATFFAMAPPVERTSLRRQLAAAYFMYAVLIGYVTVLATDSAELCLGLAADVAAVVMFGAPLVQLVRAASRPAAWLPGQEGRGRGAERRAPHLFPLSPATRRSRWSSGRAWRGWCCPSA